MNGSKRIKITLLGTGTSQGVPVIACDCEVCKSADSKDKRLRSSIMVETESTRIIVDAGPDFRTQMLREEVKSLDAVLLTHEHADHIFGLDDIRSFNWVKRGPIDIYCEDRVQNSLRSIFDYVFADKKYPGLPKMELISIDGSEIKIGDICITPIRLIHHKLPVYGFKIGKFAYLTDFNIVPENEMHKLMGIDILVVDALRKVKHISHLSLAGALSLVDKINPEKTYLTHMSHEIGKHNDLLKELPSGVEPGFDGFSFYV
jgi:phosphoribosyl 1,2-cyclic phosphate phosphodiesterase